MAGGRVGSNLSDSSPSGTLDLDDLDFKGARVGPRTLAAEWRRVIQRAGHTRTSPPHTFTAGFLRVPNPERVVSTAKMQIFLHYV